MFVNYTSFQLGYYEVHFLFEVTDILEPYIYIYIYHYFKKKQQTGHIRIINLFPSCYAFLKNFKNTKKFNRTSSDPMDKINQKRHRKGEFISKP